MLWLTACFLLRTKDANYFGKANLCSVSSPFSSLDRFILIVFCYLSWLKVNLLWNKRSSFLGLLMPFFFILNSKDNLWSQEICLGLHVAFKVWVAVHLYMVKKVDFFLFLLTTYDLSIDCFTLSFFQMAVFDHLLCMEERLNFVFFCLSQKWAFCLSFVSTKCKQKVVFCSFWIFIKGKQNVSKGI
jgi:hypothetical protein